VTTWRLLFLLGQERPKPHANRHSDHGRIEFLVLLPFLCVFASVCERAYRSEQWWAVPTRL